MIPLTTTFFFNVSHHKLLCMIRRIIFSYLGFWIKNLPKVHTYLLCSHTYLTLSACLFFFFSLSHHYHHIYIDELTTVNHSLTYNNCLTTVLCYSPMDSGECSIRYGQDPYKNLEPTIYGSINTNFTLPTMKPNTLYYYQINVTVNYTVVFQGNFTTGECEFTFMNFSMTLDNCSTTVFCYSPMDRGKCSIQYGLDPYKNMLPIINGSVNTNFTLLTMKPNTLYYYQINVTVNYTVVFQGYFTTGECEFTFMNFSMTLDNCSTTVFCYSPMDRGECSIQYGLDPYKNMLPIINGSVNTNFTLLTMKPNTLYYYQINVTVNYTVVFQGNFTTGECEFTFMNFSMTLDNCSTTVFCYSPMDRGECSIQYGLDPYKNMLPIINGSVNTNFTLLTMKPNTLYYYQINITDNYTVVFQGNFTTGEGELT